MAVFTENSFVIRGHFFYVTRWRGGERWPNLIHVETLSVGSEEARSSGTLLLVSFEASMLGLLRKRRTA
jgi:hypothetical protein